MNYLHLLHFKCENKNNSSGFDNNRQRIFIIYEISQFYKYSFVKNNVNEKENYSAVDFF